MLLDTRTNRGEVAELGVGEGVATALDDLAGRLVEDAGRRRHVLPIRVYFEDTDFSGVVYHANYLRYMERGRTEFFRLAGVTKMAMLDEVHQLPVRPDVLLLDAVTLELLDMPQIPLIEGDKRSVSIAAASVVAKVYRDLLMESYHDRYPVYDFRHNRGYATESHQAALKVYGPSPIHRKSFEGVEESMLLFGRDGKDGD